jgi:hypothetical protein
MTNEEYRKQRGTDKPFKATEKQSKRAWYEMNKKAIKARRRKERRRKSGRWTRPDYSTDPETYTSDDED